MIRLRASEQEQADQMRTGAALRACDQCLPTLRQKDYLKLALLPLHLAHRRSISL